MTAMCPIQKELEAEMLMQDVTLLHPNTNQQDIQIRGTICSDPSLSAKLEQRWLREYTAQSRAMRWTKSEAEVLESIFLLSA